ncbi:hypothetical protein [Leptolyngbya sp. NIES-2104]|uniref:hypothetical protein n=1 Tax=Leptolyngbya sp. NIES-2104 TaxID=1552121 RepID=UPI0006EC6C88|nr:hypothetical protein [Leptolyngbya sp. NIES-2104]GAP98333.1 prevent host death protein, Phd antitoxin [Leptolyngbya sp. NIES-2104]
MTFHLELPSDLEHELCEEASRLNLPLNEYILRVLSTRPDSESLPKSGAELVQYWQQAGVIASRPEINDSQFYARKLRQQAETRER